MARGVAAEDVRAVLTALQLKIRAALEKMEAGLPWSPPVVTSTLKLTDGKMRRSLEAKDGTPETIFLAAAADLFVAHWDESVRKCEAPACGRLFVPKDRREKYHSLGCGKEYRWEKFARKRVRDYAAEYERRQKKLLGRRVKIKHRRPRP
jgi:predicted RNA-binding Zn ribbon-like protein